MTDHPSTFRGPAEQSDTIAWDDRAFLHRAGDGGGVMDGAKSLRSGSFAEMIAHVMLLPEEERTDYVIQKAGDREFHAAEIEALHADPAFPGRA